jgi:transposase
MDLGDRWSTICILNAEGECVEESRIQTKPEALGTWAGQHRGMRVAIEVGTHSPWVSRLLQEQGLLVWVANPRQVRLIYAKGRKNDRLDAESLARLLRSDPQLLKPIQHRGEQTQRELAEVRMRAALVRARTLLVNHARGSAKSLGYRIPKCSSERFARLEEQIPEALRDLLQPLVAAVAVLSEKIRVLDRRIEDLARKEHPEVEALRQVDGVGPVTALAYALTLEDPSRFPSSRSVGPYLGLCPGQSQSGESDPPKRISRCGDPYLRQLLVQSAQRILGPFGKDSELRRWGLGKAAGGGKRAKRRAVVAVARKLAVLLHRLWVTGETYVPFPSGVRGEKAESVAGEKAESVAVAS